MPTMHFRNSIIHTGFAIALFCLLVGCSYNNQKPGTEADLAGAELSMLQNPDELDYAAIRSQVIGPKCLTCHATEAGNQGGINLEGYATVRRLLPRIQYAALEKKAMPPGSPLNERSALLLTTWIESGAPEKMLGPGSKPDPRLASGPDDWKKIRDVIFARKCLDCHSGDAAAKGLDLSSLAATRANAEAVFQHIFILQDMPIAPVPALTPKERKVLLNWFNFGMPE